MNEQHWILDEFDELMSHLNSEDNGKAQEFRKSLEGLAANYEEAEEYRQRAMGWA